MNGYNSILWCPHRHTYEIHVSCDNPWIDYNASTPGVRGWCEKRLHNTMVPVWTEDRL